MRIPVILFMALFSGLLWSPMCMGQQTATLNPDSWHGLMLDKSTPKDAIRTLGQPQSDKSDELRFRVIDRWIIPEQKLRMFRVLAYKNTSDVRTVELAYLENKLVRI